MQEFRAVDNGDIQPSVIRNGARRLSPSPGTAYAYGHDASADMFVVDAEVHPIEFPFKYKRKQGGHVGKEFHPPEAFGLIGDFNDSCPQSDINSIEEVAALVFFSIVEIAVPHIYFLQPVINDTVDSRFIFGTKPPIFGEVVSDTIGNHAESDVFFIFGIG